MQLEHELATARTTSSPGTSAGTGSQDRSLKKNKDSLPTALKTVDAGIAKLQTTIEPKESALGEIEKTQRQNQAALDLNRDRLTRSNAKLEGVQNSQEFQAAQKEIEQLKKLNATLEEQGKKSTADADALNKELGGLGDQIQKLQGERDAQATQLSGQGHSQLGGEIDSLMKERDKHTPNIDPRTFAQYDRIRPARAGLGIVPAVAGRCKGCNMMLPPQLYNEIQKVNQLHQCPSCHRILFAPSNTPPATDTK